MKTMFDKTVSEYTEEELLKASDYVFRYLKFDGVTDCMSDDKRIITLTTGHKIQYVDRYVAQIIAGTEYGFEDDIVYVCDAFEGKKYVGKSFLGTNWKSIESRFSIVKLIPDKVLKGVQMQVMIYDSLTKKER